MTTDATSGLSRRTFLKAALVLPHLNLTALAIPSPAPRLGVCRYSLVPVRTDPSDRSELCTQLLFGETYAVLAPNSSGAWLRVRLDYDGYEGWIDAKQHHPLPAGAWRSRPGAATVCCRTLAGEARLGSRTTAVVWGSPLPAYDMGRGQLAEDVYTFTGETHPVPETPAPFNALYALAEPWLGAPYLWGGRSPFGVDCSGFVQQVYRLAGVALPRDAWQQEQADNSRPVASLEDARPGDLAFFTNDKKRVVHVGMVLPQGRVIHAHGEVRVDPLHPEGIWNTDRKEYSHTLSTLKRLGIF